MLGPCCLSHDGFKSFFPLRWFEFSLYHYDGLEFCFLYLTSGGLANLSSCFVSITPAVGFKLRVLLYEFTVFGGEEKVGGLGFWVLGGGYGVIAGSGWGWVMWVRDCGVGGGVSAGS